MTLPAGYRPGVDAPLPTIIQPHGGPWGRNEADWGGGDIPVTQYFASRGFAVLQPQFRGSTGFGNALWRAGDGEWGQKMQDDKDDGLAWLVEQRIADPNRAMIYGFSYGGFAAIAATVRPNSPYRCAISGAGVASLQRLGTLWSNNRVQRQLQGTTVRGMDPLENASRASIPILLYHGDYDTAADIWHSERFAAALRANNKPHEYVVIPEMPHGAVNPEMRRREFQLVEDFIRGTCGISY
ncbi:MAG: prolyl oligopeptidase family serine peptidase [Hyphomonadaceae bacterium JAD_PAG50586_4]|nr:MAG: prolyl oligopeptidase family serine peptidase [Hyphomonadaceae bacterium JAD_PAG50586_4]